MIYSYHGYGNNWRCYKTSKDTKSCYYIGFELETDNYDRDVVNDERVHDEIQKNINCVLSHDSTISAFEIVSQPQTYNYIKKQEKKYRYIFDYMMQRGFTSHETGRCGLHFHFTRPKKDAAVERILLIMESFRQEIFTFSRRTNTEWCGFLTSDGQSNKEQEKIKSLYYLKGHKSTGHYSALNNSNRSTIEFRFNRGTLNYDTFMAALELCNNIYKLGCTLSRKIETINWQDLIGTSDNLRNYAKKRGLDTINKYAQDNSKRIKMQERAQRRELTKVKNILKTTIKELDEKVNDTIKRAQDYANNCRISNTQEIRLVITGLNNSWSKIDDIKSTKNQIDYIIDGIVNKNDIERTIYRINDFIRYYNQNIDDKVMQKIKKIIDSEVFN